jgi:hypothetical protein
MAQRDRHKDRALGHAFGVRVAVAAGYACVGTGSAPTATRPAHARGHPRFQSRDTAMARPMQRLVPAKRLDGRVNDVAYTVRRPDIVGWSRVGSVVKKKRTPTHFRAQRRALVRRLLGQQQQQARQWLGRCKKREHVHEALGSYTKCRGGCVHAKVQLWTKQIEHLRSSSRASNFHGSTTGQHRQTSMEKRAAWLAPACVCRRETLDAELQTGQKRRQLDLARARQRIAQLKVEPWLVSGCSSHDGETPERWCCVQVASVLEPTHKRARRCTGVAKSP